MSFWSDHCVGDADLRPLHNDRTKMTLSKIIHGFKSSVSRHINLLSSMPLFQWQRSYYDHIIRNEQSLYEIRRYIVENPMAWNDDEYNLS